ncbi:hypothetical protein PSACC_02218 [Paramicrosporidium saccamoebae]|uniref:Uncharacterized protein n=1 Tax=Paramicrosporidium saccamoebae TaxID=1246581 RepID=A0A2H9TJG4_9FUNG|nr:hypothetical protein PSACC_02218 [Paramicrosporidium saccamoebae]
MAIRSRIPPVTYAPRSDVFTFRPKEINRTVSLPASSFGIQNYELFTQMFAKIYNGETSLDATLTEVCKEVLKSPTMTRMSSIMGALDLNSPNSEDFYETESVESSAATSLILEDFIIEELETDRKSIFVNADYARNALTPLSALASDVSSYSPSIISEHSARSSLGGHRRKLSERLNRLVDRVSGRSSTRSVSRVEPRKTHVEIFRDSLAEASSLRDSFIEQYYNNE